VVTAVKRIEVRIHGTSGPDVAVLHGGPGAPGSAAGLARALGGAFRVLEPLQHRSGGEPLTVAGHVADLAAVAPPRVAIVGWSWGAMLGLSYAARHPGRVSALVLVGCGTYDEPSRALLRQRLDGRLGPLGRHRMAILRRQLEAATDPARAGHLLASLGRLSADAEGFDLRPEPDGQEIPDARGHDETWADVLRLQREGVEPAAFRAITGPVLMLHGEQDPHPGPATRDLLRGYVPQLEYRSFESCGHEPWRERLARDAFLGALIEWLAIHSG
jgi:pimeloyl-ACP methyl ester carboxylesterase